MFKLIEINVARIPNSHSPPRVGLQTRGGLKQLPFKADPAKIKAKFDKGVLKLVVQKPAEEQNKTQKIEVKAAA
jgi:Hsp20/alpha crystallin family